MVIATLTFASVLTVSPPVAAGPQAIEAALERRAAVFAETLQGAARLIEAVLASSESPNVRRAQAGARIAALKPAIDDYAAFARSGFRALSLSQGAERAAEYRQYGDALTRYLDGLPAELARSVEQELAHPPAAITSPVASQPSATQPKPADLRLALIGRWTGVLEYRDYQSDALYELPVETAIEVVPDQATMIRRSAFDDGPGKTVWITTVSVDDPGAGTTQSVSFRAGRVPEILRETVSVDRYISAEDWTLVYSTTATDDEEPAEIRVTETRSGGSLTAVKEVRPLDGRDSEWTVRNRLRLTKQDR